MILQNNWKQEILTPTKNEINNQIQSLNYLFCFSSIFIIIQIVKFQMNGDVVGSGDVVGGGDVVGM